MSGRIWLVPDVENPEAPTAAEIEAGQELTDMLRLDQPAEGAAASDPDILERIDATLDDYDQWDGHSPDAARWRGGPDEGGSSWLEPITVTFHFDTSPFADAVAQLAKAFDQLLRRSGTAEPPKPLYRPHSAAERTSSARRRAGNRRTKRHARRRHG